MITANVVVQSTFSRCAAEHRLRRKPLTRRAARHDPQRESEAANCAERSRRCGRAGAAVQLRANYRSRRLSARCSRSRQGADTKPLRSQRARRHGKTRGEAPLRFAPRRQPRCRHQLRRIPSTISESNSRHGRDIPAPRPQGGTLRQAEGADLSDEIGELELASRPKRWDPKREVPPGRRLETLPLTCGSSPPRTSTSSRKRRGTISHYCLRLSSSRRIPP